MVKTSVSLDNNYGIDFCFSDENIITFAEQLLSYAINKLNLNNFSSDNDYAFDILICDNSFIHNINKEYRKIDSSTDVITFALYADTDDKMILDNTISLGQIIISLDKVISQAKDNAVTNEYEFLNLLSHGILHLLGIDHQTDEDLEFMLNLQNEMIESVNYVEV